MLFDLVKTSVIGASQQEATTLNIVPLNSYPGVGEAQQCGQVAHVGGGEVGAGAELVLQHGDLCRGEGDARVAAQLAPHTPFLLLGPCAGRKQ